MRLLASLLFLLLLPLPAAAATGDLSRVAASLEKNRSAAKKVSRTIEELRRRRDELRDDLKMAARALGEATAGFESVDRESGVWEANLKETERITGLLRHEAVRLAAGGEMPDTARALLIRSLDASSRALAQLREGQAGRATFLEDAERERKRLIDDIAEGEGELAEIDRELRSQTKVRDRLQKEASSLRTVFADLSRAASRATGAAGLAKRLPWPLEGTASRAPGELKGLLITPGNGAQARAVAGGQVVYASPLPGLGTVVVVQHGDYFSVYGNLDSSPLVAKASVKAGEAVGSVEKGLDSASGALYFELRHHDRALDPLEWLAPAPGRGEIAR